MASGGSKRKASDDSATGDPAKKRARTIEEPNKGEVADATATAGRTVAETLGEAQDAPVELVHNTSERQTVPQPDIIPAGEKQHVEGAKDKGGRSPSPEEPLYLTSFAFRIGEVIEIPFLNPHLKNDKHINKLAQQNSLDTFESEDIGKYQKGTIPAVIVAIYTTNMVALPVLDGHLNDSGAKRRQANLNMSLEVVADTSSRKAADHPKYSKTKLFLRDSPTNAPESWQPSVGAHVHFGKPHTVEYHWRNQVMNKLTKISTRILSKRYEFVHGVLPKIELSKFQAKLVAFIKQENLDYCKDLGSDATPVSTPLLRADEDPDSAKRADPRADTAPTAESDKDEGYDDDESDDRPDPDRGTISSKPAVVKKPATSTSEEAKAAGEESVRKKSGNDINPRTKKSGQKDTVKKIASKKSPKKGFKSSFDQNDERNDQERGGESNKKGETNVESDSDSETESEDTSYQSGEGNTYRRVKLNGVTKYECSHPCKVKFAFKIPCTHKCCSNGITKIPTVRKAQLPYASDGTIPEITWDNEKEEGDSSEPEDFNEGGGKKGSKPAKRPPPPASPPKKGTATKIKKTGISRVATLDNEDDFIVPDGALSPPKTKTKKIKNKGKNKQNESGDSDNDDEDDEEDATHAARIKEMESIGAEYETTDEDESNFSTTTAKTKSKGGKQSKTAATGDGKKKAATEVVSRQGLSKASAISGVTKASTRATGPRKNQTSQASKTTTKTRSGSGSAAASTAIRKPSHSTGKTRSASAAGSTDLDRAGGAGKQEKAAKTKTKENQKAGNTDADVGIEIATNSKTKTKDKIKAKDKDVEEEQEQDTKNDEHGEQDMPGEVEDLLVETNNQSQTAENRILKPTPTPTPEPVIEEDEDPWKARAEALSEDGDSVQETENAAPGAAASSAFDNYFVLPQTEYLHDMAYGEDEYDVGDGDYGSDASE